MKNDARTAKSSTSGRRGMKTTVKNLKPRKAVKAGADFNFTRKVDKASPDL